MTKLAIGFPGIGRVTNELVHLIPGSPSPYSGLRNVGATLMYMYAVFVGSQLGSKPL